MLSVLGAVTVVERFVTLALVNWALPLDGVYACVLILGPVAE
jgi:hypothetical protein